MRIVRAESTPLFARTAAGPRQIVRVTVAGEAPGATAPTLTRVLVQVRGPGVTAGEAFGIENLPAGAERVAEVPVSVAAPHGPGSRLPVTVIAACGQARAELAAELTVAEPGWTIWMICHFHYDPVWWAAQGQFTQGQLALRGVDGRLPDARSAFELVRLHLDAARDDPDYKFVLAEIDYLKPYFDVHPQHRAELRELLAAGRVEIVGGAYNEPNTNLTSAESTIRNIGYGLGHQRDVLGADPSVAWALDAFGHDPGYPGLMAAAGMTASAWARGPYHQWGPRRTVGSNERMQFPSEFEWLSPDGRGLLTSYMADHYGAGWVLHQAGSLPAAVAEALAEFTALAPVAATRNVLLPVGADHVIPARWATAVHREFAARYAWPRCVTGLPREFFAAVRAEAAERGIWLTPQTRDMNPVYPGKDVSYIDTKQAQRAAEVSVSDGERLATLAWLAGAGYPAASLDKAWRLLVFGAHHDAITGTESDQVYLDLLGGWREAYGRGESARQAAAAYLAGQVRTMLPNPPRAGLPASAQPVVVFNTLSWPRAGLATAALAFGPGTRWLALSDGNGDVPFLAEGVRRHPDGSLADVTVTFRAEVPALGYRTYCVHEVPDVGREGELGWRRVPGTAISNGEFEAHADPGRGGALAALRHRGASLLRGPGNELVLQEEYGVHPRWGEGPWLLAPRGPGQGSCAVPAVVRAERCPIGSRLVAEFQLGGLNVTQETLLWDGTGRVEFRTHVDGSIGPDRLLRVRFPADVPGGLPVFQCATAVVGRPFGAAGTDVAEHAFTLDNPAHEWFGLGSTARVRAGDLAWAIGVAEIVVPGGAGGAGLRAAVRELVAALARAGVTATCSRADGPRYGALDLDSNLPDVRIAVGGPAVNAWTDGLAGTLPADVAAGLSGPGPVWIPADRDRAAVFTPGADVRGERDLPVLAVTGEDLAGAVRGVAGDLADSVIEASLAAGPAALAPDPLLAPHSVALLNAGTPSSLVTPDGTLHIALMRAPSAWPAGVWIDGPRRTAPDGSSFAWQHWSHTFRYALAAGPGDWRDAGFATAGQEYNHDLIACQTGVHDGPLPPATSLGEVTGAQLTALKPRGNPLACGAPGGPQIPQGPQGPGGAAEVTVRLAGAGSLPPNGPAEVTLRGGVAAARLTDLTETADGAGLPVPGNRALVPVGAGPVTVAITPAGAPRPAGHARAGPEQGGAEPVRPVFTRYWLHGKGPAPAGNLPATVHLSPARVGLTVGGTATLVLTVACGPAGAAGEVTLDVPAGLAVAAADLRYALPPGGYRRWELPVRALPGAGGRYFVCASITDDLGQVLEDAALLTAGEPPEPPLDLPRPRLAALLAASAEAEAAELAVSLAPAGLTVAPGECATLAVTLVNRTAGRLRGECQLLSPFGTWRRDWARGFGVAAGGTEVLEFGLPLPPAARPGSQWWALAKVTYFGRVRCTECARITVGCGPTVSGGLPAAPSL